MADAIFEPEIRRSMQWLLDSNVNVPSMAFECKRVATATLPFGNVKAHQEEGLKLFEEHGMAQKMIVSQGFGERKRFTGSTPFDFMLVPVGVGFLLVNFRFTKKSPRKDIPKGTNRCFGVEIHEYIQAKEDAISDGRSSLPYEWFVGNAIECPRLRKKNAKNVSESGWDLEPLLTY